MPVLPLMPTGQDQMASPMPGAMPGGGPPPMHPGMGGADPASQMGLGMAGMNPLQGALGQFDKLAQTVSDLARTFPGSDSTASQMMQLLDQWRQQVLIMVTPQSSSM